MPSVGKPVGRVVSGMGMLIANIMLFQKQEQSGG